MLKLNCWEWEKCTTPDCPSKKAERFNGFNCGKNGGRICWYVNYLASGGKKRGEQVQKCSECNFFHVVEQEEGSDLILFV